MNTVDPLPLQVSMVDHEAGRYDQWRGFLTVIDINHGQIILSNICTAVIHVVTEFDVPGL
jgi:hypothetical protein